MKMLCDLHTHSTTSDGQYTPSELVSLARQAGIEVLALTDHDTLDGLSEAIQAGNAAGLRVISGVELSAREYDTFHILGYAFRRDAPELQELCRHMRQRREERNPRLLAFLHCHGIDLSLEEVRALSGGAVLGRPHFAQAMVRRGYVKSSKEAFDCYLDTEEYHQEVERDKPSVQECVEAIHASGGKAVLAHPYQIGLEDDALEELVSALVAGCCLDGIECFYPRHTPEQTAFYLGLAEKYRLHTTGGSDFHGEAVKPDISLTSWHIDVGWLSG